MHIFLDIETCPTRDPELIAEIAAGVTPPGNISKAETIAAWERDKKPAAVADAIGRTALDAAAGQVIAIGLALDYGAPAEVLIRDRGIACELEQEQDLMRRFVAWVDKALEGSAVTDAAGRTVWPDAPQFVAHNAAFDLGFLWRRAVVTGITPQGWKLPAPWTMRHGKDHFCTMTAWAGPRERISLKRLCRALGHDDPKAAGDGAQAWQWWEAGDLDKLARYCAGDVEAVRAIWQDMMMNGGLAA